AYGQYVTIGTPTPAPAAVTGLAATGKSGAIDVKWDAAEHATRYFVTAKTASGTDAPGTPVFVTGTSTTLQPLPAGTEYTISRRAETVAFRPPSAPPVKATATAGERVTTTTTVELQGPGLAFDPMKLVATVSDPAATGTIRFYNGTSLLL